MSFASSAAPAQPRRRNAQAGKLRMANPGMKGPVAAKLTVENVRGEIGIVDGDLGGLLGRSTAAAVEDQSWSIIPVRIRPPQAQSQMPATTTIHVPSSASSLQPFLELQKALEGPKPPTLN
ncbi:peroxisomal assembly protein, partial [Ascosphaera atra]